MELSRVQAVLLDMDGTLVDSDAAVERAWMTWAVEYRVDMGSVPLIAHGMPALGNVRRLRPDLPEDEAAAAAQRQLELQYDDVADVTAAPGAAELLGELDRLGLPWAVVTSADPTLARVRLAAARIRPALLVTSATCGQASPTPRATCWPPAGSAPIPAGAWWWRTPRPASRPGGRPAPRWRRSRVSRPTSRSPTCTELSTLLREACVTRRT